MRQSGPLALATVAVYAVMTGVNLALGYGLRRLANLRRVGRKPRSSSSGSSSPLLLLIGSLFAESIEIIIPYSVRGADLHLCALLAAGFVQGNHGLLARLSSHHRADAPRHEYKTSWIVKLAVTIFFVIFGLRDHPRGHRRDSATG